MTNPPIPLAELTPLEITNELVVFIKATDDIELLRQVAKQMTFGIESLFDSHPSRLRMLAVRYRLKIASGLIQGEKK